MIDLLHVVVENIGRGTLGQICLTLFNFDIPSTRTMYIFVERVQDCPGQKPFSLRGRFNVCMNIMLESSCLRVDLFIELRLTCQVRRLLTHPNMTSQNSKAVWGESPLMGAVARGQLEVVKVLVEVEAIDVDTLDGQGRTLLQVARCAFV